MRGVDANLELCMPCDGSTPSTCVRSLLQSFALEFTVPSSCTWWNMLNPGRLITFSGPRAQAVVQGVQEQVAHLLGVDHALVFATVTTTKIVKHHRRKRPSKCGKWAVRLGDAVQSCAQFAATSQSLDMLMIEQLASKVSFRPPSFRFRDSPETKQLIQQRQECSDPQEAKDLAVQVVGLRCSHQQAWLAGILERARPGDFQAVSYMKRRQSMGHTL